MKKKIQILLFIGLLVTIPTFSQVFSPIYNGNKQLTTKQAFSLKDYKLQSEVRSDTIWLPQRQDRYRWNGVELAKISTYELLTYNSPDELSIILIMDTQTKDSLLMANYEFDEQSRSICGTFKIYDSTNKHWIIDYRALLSYDTFGCHNKTMIQAWDAETVTWHDSIAEYLTYIDTNEISDQYIEEYINGEWKKIFGYQWDFHFTSEHHVFEQYNYMLNTQSGEYENHVYAEFLLNDDGSWYESLWYYWDENTKEWIFNLKYTEVEWAVYNTFPNNYKNKISHRIHHWWIGTEWYAYLEDDIEYPSPGLNDQTRHSYFRDIESEQWYLYNDYKSHHYPFGWKRRYTDYLRNSIHEEMMLNYDDSITYVFYKGAMEELYRVNYDTATNRWLPAARMVYSDFVPFVVSTAIDEKEVMKEKLEIIPNPSKGLVEIANNRRISEISVFDSSGNCVKQLTGQ
nr:hypothetical protein [Bacteroidota bacterium]